MLEPDKPLILHASAVALDTSGVLITGASGSGKSSLALELMSRGASLIADDRVIVTPNPQGDLWLSCPQTISGMIEARGVGILGARAIPGAVLRVIVDLDKREEDRLPPYRETSLMGRNIPLLHHSETPYFPAAVLQYLKEGRRD